MEKTISSFYPTNCTVISKDRDKQSHAQIHQLVTSNFQADLQVALVHTKNACLARYSKTHILDQPTRHARQSQIVYGQVISRLPVQIFLDSEICHTRIFCFENRCFQYGYFTYSNV